MLNDHEKTKEQLIGELTELRQLVTGFKVAENNYKNIVADLRKSQDNYKLLVENQTDLIVRVGVDERFQYVSPSYCKTFGKSEQELLGKRFFPLVHEDDREITEKEMKKLFQPPYCCWVEQRALTSKGWRWFGWADKAVLNEDNEVIAIVAIGRDITEQKDAQHLVARMGKILDGSFNEIYVFDAETLKFIHVNKRALSNLGYTEDEMLNLTPNDIKPEMYQQELVTYLDPLKDGTKQAQVFETIHQRKDGTLYPVEIRLELSNIEIPAVFVAIVQDITDRKWAETSRLESVGVLAGGIAHDFNNILTGITGNVSLAKMKLEYHQEDHESVQILLAETEKAALQARHLTHQLLTFAKGGEPILKKVSVHNLLKQNVNFVLRGSNILCDFQLPPDLWPLKVDSGQINQVIQNLVINACQAMPQGGCIQLKAENVELDKRANPNLKEGLYVKISIKDNGIGMPKDIIPRIYDPYFTTKQKGSGLGLAIVHSIVRKHEGHIMVESEAGCGTEFNVYLPACQECVEVNREKIKLPLKGTAKILLMDDEKILREVVTDMLEYLGYNVTCAVEGKEAIDLYMKAKVTGNPFDAVIMDLTIPGGMGGKEAIQKLIQIDPGVKAIVASGYSNDPVMARYKDFGFMDIISKPFGIEELGRVLQNLLCDEGTMIKRIS